MKTKILIVDDEPMNLDFFDLMLSKLGFDVLSAENGMDALEKIKEAHPDLILLDNIMPKMSGWQVTKILKTDERYTEFSDIPVIMFSAMDDVQDKIEGFELGVDDYITKPFNFSEVIARIRAVLKHREMYRKMLRREHGINHGRVLSDSVKFVINSLKPPLEQILSDSKALDITDQSSLKAFISTVKRETSDIIKSFSKIEEDIAEFENEGMSESSDYSFLKEYDKKIRAHFLESKVSSSSKAEEEE